MAFRVTGSVQLQDEKLYIEAYANSSDEKPIEIAGQELSEGSSCIETDTGSVFFFSETTHSWKKIGE